MWLEITFDTFDIRQRGFHRHCRDDGSVLYVSPGLTGLESVAQIRTAEYGQAIAVNPTRRTVSFARDYLGHFPLLYACTDKALFISDELGEVRQWLLAQGGQLTLSEEALALYFTMGYVPQGHSLFDQIRTCKNASIYHWERGRLRREDIFQAVETDRDFPLVEIKHLIDDEVARLAASSDRVDVWCSGGLDSSIMAHCCNSQGRRADLLSLSYDDAIRAEYGDGEWHFAQEMASHCGARLREVKLTKELYTSVYQCFVQQHINPVVDIVVPPKYALASASREFAVTGEGGDPLFSGVKNNMVLYLLHRNPRMPVGHVYALAHGRLFSYVDKLLKRGGELVDFVANYFDKQFAAYPGDITRKLFYLNALGKQGGMIFPKNYYAGKRYGVKVRHPMTALSVYEAAFRLSDEKKYQYPIGKLALIELYKDNLPDSIVKRRKSGTRLPLRSYMKYITGGKTELSALFDSDAFNNEALSAIVNSADDDADSLLMYGLHTLDQSLSGNNGGNNHDATISFEPRSDKRPLAYV